MTWLLGMDVVYAGDPPESDRRALERMEVRRGQQTVRDPAWPPDDLAETDIDL